LEALKNLEPGVTEIHIQPAIDTPEVRALGKDAQGWIDDYIFATEDKDLEAHIKNSGAVLIGYRELRDAMRAG
jgi:hypothetical protein